MSTEEFRYFPEEQEQDTPMIEVFQSSVTGDWLIEEEGVIVASYKTKAGATRAMKRREGSLKAHL